MRPTWQTLGRTLDRRAATAQTAGGALVVLCAQLGCGATETAERLRLRRERLLASVDGTDYLSADEATAVGALAGVLWLQWGDAHGLVAPPGAMEDAAHALLRGLWGIAEGCPPLATGASRALFCPRVFSDKIGMVVAR